MKANITSLSCICTKNRKLYRFTAVLRRLSCIKKEKEKKESALQKIIKNKKSRNHLYNATTLKLGANGARIARVTKYHFKLFARSRFV